VLSETRVRALRLRAQLLTGRRPGTVGAAVSAVLALQAQATPAARLAVRVRTSTVDAAAVDRACAAGEVVRTWAMRGTLHMLAANDVRWVVALLGPVFAAAARRRRLQLGLDDATCERGLAALAEVLAGAAPLTRADLVVRLADAGVRLEPRSQAVPHLLGYAALHGLICRGPERGAEPTYVLLDSWVPATPARSAEDALAELARRYLAGHGPAGAEDFAAWSGLPVTRARAGFAAIAGEVTPVGPAAVLSCVDLDAPPPPRVVRLLGQFDAYLLGWRGRDLILDPAYAKRIQAGGGMIQPALVVDGRVAGTWRLDRRRVVVEEFEPLSRRARDGLEAEVADLGRFLGVTVTL
jgi:hypothetical protein